MDDNPYASPPAEPGKPRLIKSWADLLVIMLFAGWPAILCEIGCVVGMMMSPLKNAGPVIGVLVGLLALQLAWIKLLRYLGFDV